MRVFIVEDCEIFRLSLMLVLAQESDIEVVGASGSNINDICAKIIASGCETLLVGLRLRNCSGLDIARQVKQINPDIPILALGFATDAASIADMRSSGINVFVPMHSSNEYIAKRVRYARENLGRCDFSSFRALRVIDSIQNNQELSV